MREFIIEFRYVIAWVLGAILFCLLEWQWVKVKLYSYMLVAKDMAKDKVLKGGDAQLRWVTVKAMQRIPGLKYVPEQWVMKIISWLYDKAKDYLDDGELNNSIQ